MFLLGQAVGKYQILSNLGSGGFGTVFLAKDAWIDKKVAIKVPHRQSGDFDDLLQEPRLLAALDHPNIVGIVTAERVDGVFFIVMEYVKGESLEQVLDREKSLDVPRALHYTVQVLKGVEHAHQNQILHRDLRPANVLVSESGVIKVADFGTSRLLEKSHATTVIGSPPYMAPEQFQGRAVLASDIYSVGVILYQMLTGTLPYFSPNPAQIERMVAQGRCTPPRLRNGQIPREISDIVMKAIAPELADRYQRASELLDDLATAGEIDHKATEMEDIRKRLKAREAPRASFCWHCRKPLHARSNVCPFCGESQ
ncbi:MAG TPA: serine/threonine-protein kinase [Vicinamibacteria bacterium]|nr:serine/threonine-protein kinase [Vicinamibacteria bacterium]